MKYSNKAVGAIIEEIEKLEKSIGKEVGLKHIDSNNIHYGILKDIVDDYIILDKNGKEVKINIANVSLMEEKEFNQWKRDNLKRFFYDVSILFKKEVNPDIILKLLKAIYDIEILDIYEGDNIKEGFKSITFRIYSYNREDLNNLKKSFLEVIKNIGGIERYGT